MSNRKVVTVILLGVALSVLVGWGTPAIEMKLNLSPQSETVYKVVTGTEKDYAFTQPSINKTKERHTVGRLEMVFSQKIESVDKDGTAAADITIKQLRYVSQDAQGKEIVFDSTKPESKTDPLMQLIGAGYKIRISPKGSIEVLDVAAARSIIKEGSSEKVASRLFSDEEIARRHQVMALFDADKCQNPKDRAKIAKAASSNKKSVSKASKKVSKGACKKGYQWSSLTASPPGMLRSKTFEKVYTLADIKEQNGQKIATVEMNAATSSKRSESTAEKEPAMSFFSNMFDEKDEYSGKMILNLTNGQISRYEEKLRAEWLAAEPSDQQKSDKGPDQLSMGFTSLYSIEKVDSKN